VKRPLVSRRRHQADLAAANAEADRLRGERDAALRSRNEWHTAASTTASQYVDATVVNDCLTRRVEQLQARLDDACGLNDPAVEAAQNWQGRRTDKPIVKEPTT
jgi:hypothetical protein